jgi:hypothetical protein
MQDLPVLVTIAGFAVMGIGAIAKPALVTAQVGIFFAVASAPCGLWSPVRWRGFSCPCRTGGSAVADQHGP